MLYAAVTLGAAGGILAVANVLPDQCVALYEHAAAGRREEALKLLEELLPLSRKVLGPEHPDTLETVRVVEIGGFFGGIAGFHDLYVRLCRTHD